MPNLTQTSKFLSLLLRHNPSAAGITLDEHGWANVDELIAGVNAAGGYNLTMETLEEIVRTDGKQRYSFNEDHTLIRANQGHSIPVDVELEEAVPPDTLYHGTGEICGIDRPGGAYSEKQAFCAPLGGHSDRRKGRSAARKAGNLQGGLQADGGGWIQVLSVGQ